VRLRKIKELCLFLVSLRTLSVPKDREPLPRRSKRLLSCGGFGV